MHSLAMAQNILKAAIDEAEKQQAEHIRAFIIKVGDHHYDEADSLQFCLEAAAKGTIAEGARIDIEYAGLTYRCCECEQVFTANHTPVCPKCGSDDAEVLIDEEFLRVSLELD